MKTEECGLAFIKNQQRYFREIEKVKKGRKKGWFKITLLNNRKVVIHSSALIRQGVDK